MNRTRKVIANSLLLMTWLMPAYVVQAQDLSVGSSTTKGEMIDTLKPDDDQSDNSGEIAGSEETVHCPPSKPDCLGVRMPGCKKAERGICISTITYPPSPPPKEHCQEKALSLLVLFDYNSDQLNPMAIEQLRLVGEALADDKLKGLNYRVEGHTDAVGSDAYNQDLSKRRAESVKQYLKYQFSFSGKEIHAIGKGESQLADTSDPSSEKNRRVRVVSYTCSATINNNKN